MLSIENLSDPSVPCKASALKGDERASDTLAFQEAAEPIGLSDETQPPHFSIRDYVFNSRSKDVTKNWPFPLKLLQLYLEYGVNDILPPFEPPDLVRGQCCRRGVEFEHLIAGSHSEQISTEVRSLETNDVGPTDEEPDNIRHEFCLPPDQFVVECSDQAQHLLLKSRKSKVDHRIHSGDELISVEAEPVSTFTSHDQIERISGQISELHCTANANKSILEASSELEVEEPPLLPEKLQLRREPSEKKCRLIVKLSSSSETIRVEDTLSTSSTVSDPMASKVCPVCKTFTSTSNTTLNAHIDQCLSKESNTKHVMTKLSKFNVKPRKKRLMVDIYTTAPHCTIEDLDRRNGTNWAVDLGLVAPTCDVSSEIKRPKLSIPGAANDGNEGAVYVDSNGMKLRIISKFNDVLPVNSKENLKLRKHVKGIKAGRSCLISKKKCSKSKHSKCMKINQQKKRLCSFKLFQGKTQVAQTGDCHSNTSVEKEESPSCLLNAEDQVKSRGPGTLRQWACSKRSGPLRKLNKKGTHKSIESMVPGNSVEGNQPDPGNSSAVKSHILKLPRSTEALASSLKTKRVDVLSNSVHATHNLKTRPPKPPESNSRLSPENISLASSLMLKPSRSSRNFVSLPRSKREQIELSTIQKSDDPSDINTIHSECCHPSLKTTKRLMSKKNVLLGRSSSLEESKGDESVKRSTIKKFRKHRSILVTHKRRGKLPSNINEGLHGSTEDFIFDHSPRANETSNAHQPNLSENLTISTVQASEQEREGFCTTVKQQHTKNRLHLGATADCYVSDMEASDMQHEPFGCDDFANEPSRDKAVDAHGSSENLIIQHLTPASSPRLNPWPSEQEHGESFGGSEAPVEGGLNDEQVVQFDGVTSEKTINKNIEQVGDVGNLCIIEQSKDQISTSIKVSSTGLIVPVDMVLGFPQENSSITMVRMMSSQDHNLAGGIETSASPASTSSNICPSYPELSQSKDFNSKQCVKDTADQDKLSSSLINNSELPSVSSTRGTEGMEKRRNQEVKAIAAAKEPEKLSDDEPCYCSHWESLSQEPLQPLRQSIMTNSVFPSKVKQIVSNFCIRPTISSTPSAFHCSITGEMSAPIWEPPTESILTEVPSDFASESKLPPGSDIGLPSPYSQAQGQATFNPIFRLMGKDLVVKNEELAQPPKVLPSDSDFASTMKCLPPGFTSTNRISFSYQQHQIPSGCAILSQDSSKAKQKMSGYVGVPSIKSQQKRSKKLHSPLPSSIGTTTASQHHQKPISSSRAPYRDVIVIDDSPEVEAELNRSIPSPAVALPPSFPASNLIPPRPLSCFRPKSPYVSGEVLGIVRPSYSMSHQMANAYIPVKHDYTSEVSVPRSSYIFQSPSTAHRTSSFCYSRTLQ